MDIVLSVTEKTDIHLHNRLLTSRQRIEQNDKGSGQNDPLYVKLFKSIRIWCGKCAKCHIFGTFATPNTKKEVYQMFQILKIMQHGYNIEMVWTNVAKFFIVFYSLFSLLSLHFFLFSSLSSISSLFSLYYLCTCLSGSSISPGCLLTAMMA